MVDSAIHAVHDYLPDASLHFLELIKGDNPDSFTRLRKLSVLDIIYQMFENEFGSSRTLIEELMNK